MLRLAALVFSTWVLLTGCTAEELQHFNEAVAAFNCGLEGKTCPASGPARAQEAAPTAASPSPAQPPNLMGAVEVVFEDVTWAQLKGQRRTALNWKVVDAEGQESVANIEIVFVNNYREVTHWCQNVIQAVFGNEHKAHPACGCTRPGPPWRIVVIGISQPGCQSPSYVLAHELWHTKGNLGAHPRRLVARELLRAVGAAPRSAAARMRSPAAVIAPGSTIGTMASR